MRPYDYLKPILFRLPAETAHSAIHALLDATQHTPVERALAARYVVNDARLHTTAFGCEFPNPVGVAAGFDKNAEVPRALAALGFGHVEIGGVTANPQKGNPRPRLFRLPEDGALVNRMGFNNHGAERIGDRLARARVDVVPVGVNLGKSKATPLEEAPADYRYSYEHCATGDYFVVNVSSPNTPGLRDLQGRDHLEDIFETLQEAGADPLLVKLSPDLTDDGIEEALAVAERMNLDGVIATNTTTERATSLRGEHRTEEGGLSGKPLEARATQRVRFVAERTELPVVGVGGVSSAEGAYRKIRAGASLVQLYTGLVYRGPAIARDINRGLLELLEKDGFDSVADAVGTDLD
ncbi:quinone-dependent dihydroorotate dehydrogenase [Halococcus sediminicola]|uniref:quinone-dependent dihydroorotate dehydrogenase n=1 Tax=Halococcus sediminicola TaxID=1264579 RepID=UPI0006785814|nr:quinone-dependent dihydroorotate dehydrogenase [Halococcus sediminicola]